MAEETDTESNTENDIFSKIYYPNKGGIELVECTIAFKQIDVFFKDEEVDYLNTAYENNIDHFF